MVDIHPISITSVNPHDKEEILQNIKSQDKSNIPTCYEEITSSWLKMTVNQFRIRKGLEPFPEDVEIKSFKGHSCKHNAGKLSSVYLLHVQILDASYQFVAKFLPTDDSSILEACHKNVFEKEISIYFDLLPAIKCSVSESIATLIPEVIYASHNENGAGAIVFKSCEMDGYFMVEDPKGLSSIQLHIAIKSLARFHAFASKFIDDATLQGVKERYEFLDRAKSTQFSIEKDSSLGDLEPGFKEILSKSTSYVLNKKFLTIIHGEYWEPNLMFDEYNPKGMQILDWKHARLGSGVFDLAFLLGTHVLDGKELQEYIKLYFDTYYQTCESLSHNITFDMDDLHEEYGFIFKSQASKAVALALKKELIYLNNRKADVPSRRDTFRKRAQTLLYGMVHDDNV